MKNARFILYFLVVLCSSLQAQVKLPPFIWEAESISGMGSIFWSVSNNGVIVPTGQTNKYVVQQLVNNNWAVYGDTIHIPSSTDFVPYITGDISFDGTRLVLFVLEELNKGELKVYDLIAGVWVKQHTFFKGDFNSYMSFQNRPQISGDGNTVYGYPGSIYHLKNGVWESIEIEDQQNIVELRSNISLSHDGSQLFKRNVIYQFDGSKYIPVNVQVFDQDITYPVVSFSGNFENALNGQFGTVYESKNPVSSVSTDEILSNVFHNGIYFSLGLSRDNTKAFLLYDSDDELIIDIFNKNENEWEVILSDTISSYLFKYFPLKRLMGEFFNDNKNLILRGYLKECYYENGLSSNKQILNYEIYDLDTEFYFDNCDQSRELKVSRSVCYDSYKFKVRDATPSGLEASCESSFKNDIFFNFYADTSWVNMFFINPISENAVITLYDSCNGVELFCQSTNEYSTKVIFKNLEKDTRYTIRVAFDSLNNSNENIEICLTQPDMPIPSKKSDASCGECNGSYYLDGNKAFNVSPGAIKFGICYKWSDKSEEGYNPSFEIKRYNLCPGEYAISFTDYLGYARIDSFTIKGYDSLFVEGKEIVACPGEDVLLALDTVAQGLDISSFYWKGPNNFYYDGFATELNNVSAKDAGIYILHGYYNSNCTFTDTINLIIGADIHFEGDNVICKDGTVQIKITETFPSYKWSTGEETQYITVNQAGDYSVTVTNADGCTGEKVFELEDAPSTVFDFTGLTEFCIGYESEITVNEQFENYQWSTGDVTKSIVVLEAGAYWVTVTDSYGCTNSDVVYVNTKASEEVEIEGLLQFCKGYTSTLLVQDDYPGYVWNTGDTTHQIEVSESGVYEVEVYQGLGCYYTSSVEVMVMDTFIPKLDVVSTDLCQGDSMEISLIGDYTSILWNDGSKGQSLVISSAGTYWVSVTAVGGCTGEDYIEITARQAPQVSIDGIQKICPGESATLTITGGGSNVTYNWNGNIGDSTIVVSPNVTTTYTCIVENAFGCSTEVTHTIEVDPLPEIELKYEQQICLGDEIVISYVGAVIDNMTFDWDFDNAEVISGVDAGPFILNKNETGIITGSLTTKHENCTNTTTFVIEVVEQFEVFLKEEQCDSFEWHEETLTESGAYIYKGKSAIGCDSIVTLDLTIHQSQEINNIEHVCDVSQVGVEEFVYQGSNSCDSIVRITYVLVEPVVINVENKIHVPPGTELELVLDLNVNPGAIDSIIWSGYDAFNCQNCLAQSIEVNEDLSIQVKIIDQYGCIYFEEITIRIKDTDDVYIPNIFSPNGDNLNDLFLLNTYKKELRLDRLEVYDRWGNKVYSQGPVPIKEMQGWDGTFNHQPLSAGVYAVQVFITNTKTGRTYHRKGTLMLVR